MFGSVRFAYIATDRSYELISSDNTCMYTMIEYRRSERASERRAGLR